MPNTLHRFLAALVILITATVALTPGHVLAGGNVAPREMLQTYYALINSRDYATAYAQWVHPAQTYAEFVAGYADTVRVESRFGGYQHGAPGGIQGRIPGVLIGYRTNGSVAAFSGCYDVSYFSAVTGLGQWRIANANFAPMSTIPTGQQIEDVLKMDCYGYTNANGSYSSVQAMLTDYYNAINRMDYAAAYALWATPVQTYGEFVSGWADTREAVMFLGGYQWGGNPNALETGRVPVVLFGCHTDGSLRAYEGCFSVNYNARLPRHWSILGADLRPLPFVITPDAAAIQAALGQACY